VQAPPRSPLRPNGPWRTRRLAARSRPGASDAPAHGEAGAAADPRLGRAIDWVLAQDDDRGRWPNRYAHAGKMVVDIDVQGQPGKWVTLRACRVRKAVAEGRSTAAGSGTGA
jgi:hypothetical protein